MNIPAENLLDKIKRLIHHNGPINLGEFMHICMADPQFGYYKSRNAIGRSGDFITAPEVSQMFGELIGVWCIAMWQNLGKPSPFCLAELGPGKATLIHDVLRTAKSNSEFFQALHLSLIETSERLQKIQREKILPTLLRNDKISWHIDIDQLPKIPTIFIANEFFDVVPFRQFVKRQGNWHEIGIGLAQNGGLQKLALANCLDETSLPQGAELEPDGAVFENSPAREAIMQTVAERIKDLEGAAIIFDYGHLTSGFGDTFQALQGHQYSDPLAAPGLADLTSHVDFAALENSARKTGLINICKSEQGDFLLALGLLERAGILGQGKDTNTQNQIRADVERLAGPKQMGALFKVLALSSSNNTIPGFTPR